MGKIAKTLKLFGFDFTKTIQSIYGLGKFYGDYKSYKVKAKNAFPVKKMIPILTDHCRKNR